MRRYLLLLVFVACGCVGADRAWGYASLAREDFIDEVVVTVNGVAESVSLIRDAADPAQWYYIPNGPRLYEYGVGNERRPEFLLIRYQSADPANPEKLIEAGLLQFSIRLGLPAEVLPSLRAQVQRRVGAGPEPRLAALPFKSATVSVYSDDGALIARAPHGPGIAPTFATQKMAFTVPLTKLGADAFDTLTRGNTGIGVAIEFTYQGLTPATGVDCTINWDSAYRLMSENKVLAAKVGYLGFFSGSYDKDTLKVREELKRNGAIDCGNTILEGSEAENSTQTLLATLKEQLFQKIDLPDNIATTASAPDLNKDKEEKKNEKDENGKLKWFEKLSGSVAYSVKIKDIDQRRTGTERIDLRTRKLMERKSSASGFIGVGRYPAAIRDDAVKVVQAGPWTSAFFILPAVGDDQRIGITRVDFEVRMQTGTVRSQVASWTPAGGWKDAQGRPRTSLVFPLLGVVGRDLPRVSFSTETTITRGADIMRVARQYSGFDGEKAIATPLSAVNVVQVDGTGLAWQKLGSGSLVKADVSLTAGPRKFQGVLKPAVIDGKFALPPMLHWLVPPDATVVADIQFLKADTPDPISWRRNGTINKGSGQPSEIDGGGSLMDITLRDLDVAP